MRERLNVNSIEDADKKARMRWTGHVFRVNGNRLTNRMFCWKIGQRASGKPRRRFSDSVENNLFETKKLYALREIE